MKDEKPKKQPKKVKQIKKNAKETEDKKVEQSKTKVKVKRVSYTVIRSADNRQLEISIGRKSWTGNEIKVPSELAGEIRRILLAGGFFLRD